MEKDIRKGSTDQNQANDQEEDVQEEEEEEEEEAPAISLEDYLKERNITDDGPVQEETLNLNLQKIAQDSKMKVVVKTKTGTDLPVTKKNNDIKGLAKATLNSVGGKAFEEPREPREQGERRGGRGGDFKKFNGERREFNGEKREFKGERREYKPRAQAQPEGDAPAENGAPKTESNEAGNQERDGGDRRPRGRGGRGGNGGNGAPRGGRGGRGGRPTDGPRDPAPEGTQTSGRGGKTFVKRGGSRNETHLTEADFPSL